MLLVAPASSSGAIRYTLTDLGHGEAYAVNNLGQVVGTGAFVTAPGGGAMTWIHGGSVATAINDAGHVAGYTYTVDGPSTMFWWDGTTVHHGPEGEAYAINASDQVAGQIPSIFYGKVFGVGQAAVWSPAIGDAVTEIDMPISRAYGIDAAGRVAGFIMLGSGLRELHAFVSSPDSKGPITDLGNPGTFNSSVAAAINSSGQIAGWSSYYLNALDPYERNRAFLSNPGTGAPIDLGSLPGGWRSAAFGINDAGQVVGYSEGMGISYDERNRAFLYEGGTMYDLNDLVAPGSGIVLTEARSISNTGYIAATGNDADGFKHAVLLTPLAAVPEPHGMILLTSGAGCLLCYAAWRRARNENAPPGRSGGADATSSDGWQITTCRSGTSPGIWPT